MKLQAWVKSSGQKVIVIFERRDAAGKGGTIKRFIEHLNPRGARVVALDKPSEKEKGQWYFQRYVEQLPTAGEDALGQRDRPHQVADHRLYRLCCRSGSGRHFSESARWGQNHPAPHHWYPNLVDHSGGHVNTGGRIDLGLPGRNPWQPRKN
ncbi:hypothetical protein [Acidithiobacillus sp.]|uniref:hypothetical protein n=1 Tax=Acidithiobacillus sp. TaxID=1872118 RepID=UPI002614773F|nr:hypothetical protein [Acidithiobacillus sp.]MDD2749036.1 hypothetical protein [Acidithiobacillus sp.]MDD5280352.1 hypothetical protein [Acidithiobacillus sp.]